MLFRSRSWGDPQWHAGVDPASVETQAGNRLCDYYLGWKPVTRRDAVYRVACLEFCGALLKNTPFCAKATRDRDDCCKKPAWQKRLETEKVLSRKTPRLYVYAKKVYQDILEIIVWSKRQSSHAIGDGAFQGLKGNRFSGDGKYL